MRHGPVDHSGFVASLHAELAGFQALQQTLESEQACLLSADVDALVHLVTAKAQQIEHLSELARARERFLAAADLDGGRAGMSAWLRAHAGTDAPRLTALWQRLLDAASQARTLNELNGSLIATRLSHNHAALTALQDAARGSSTYGPDGHAALPSARRELGQA